MLKSETRNGIEILSFENVSKLNILVAQSLKEEIAQYLNKPGKKLILNLDGIEYIDSSGFGALLSILRNAKNNDSFFKICNISPDVMELVKLLQLHNVFEIHDTVEDCIDSF
ncbi:MAG: STAS domain-containing protein [Bacteroidales bacterium]